MALASVGTDYCAYSHYAEMLERSGTDWLVVMFEAYLDDSGTHRESDLAIAACYISTKRGWTDFVTEWDHARFQEGFDAFHMAHFMAPNKQGEEPWCHWDDAKKRHVYSRLAKIVNTNKRIGIAAVVPKQAYDTVPENIREIFGKDHYTFAVRTCMNRIWDWREKYSIGLPIQYIFDWEMQGSQKRKEIEHIFDSMHESWKGKFGVEETGYSFQHKEKFKPLQAADILAWQMNNHMRKIISCPERDIELCHPGFILLRADQEMDLGFFTPEAMKAWEIRELTNEEARLRGVSKL
jgi:hypothetical protein